MAERTDAATRLAVGLVALPYNLLVIVVALLLAVPLYVLNNLWVLVFGRPLLSGNSRLGFVLYTAQANVQSVVTGRGDLRWWYFSR